MAEKRVSVRLVAVGGRQVRAELEGVGEAGARGFGRLCRARWSWPTPGSQPSRAGRGSRLRQRGRCCGGGTAMIRSGLRRVDAQAKLAASLKTTVESMQVLERRANWRACRWARSSRRPRS
jgi:hypothetical protein